VSVLSRVYVKNIEPEDTMSLDISILIA